MASYSITIPKVRNDLKGDKKYSYLTFAELLKNYRNEDSLFTS